MGRKVRGVSPFCSRLVPQAPDLSCDILQVRASIDIDIDIDINIDDGHIKP